MVTPFDEDGDLDVDGAVTLARQLADHGSDGARGRRHDRRGPGALRRRAGRAVAGGAAGGDGPGRSPARAPTTPVTPSSCTKLRRSGGVAGVLVGDALLQPAVAGRARQRTSGRWPRPPRFPCSSTTSRCARAARSPTTRMRRSGPRRAQHRGGEGRRRRRGRLGAARRRGFAAGSSSTAATTRSPCRCWRWVRSARSASPPTGPVRRLREIVAAFAKGDVDGARLAQRHAVRLATPSRPARTVPEPAAGQGRLPGPGPPRRPVPASPRHGAAPSSSDRARTVLRRSGARRACRCRRRSGGSACAEPVRIIFLGGLGEIGRNCACFELDGRIVVLDCGVMFPDPDMPGIDLVLPGSSPICARTPTRVEAVVLTHGHEDHTGGLAFLLRELVAPRLRLGAHPGPRPQPGGGGRPARPGALHRGDRRRAAADRALRCGVHPRHPLGAARLRHRVPHPAGRRSCTPATSRST